MYGLQHVDIILNSTGGDVVYDKWFKYNQARSIENSCYSFATMGGSGFGEHPKCYVYGFSPSGKPLSPVLLKGGNIRNSLPGEIYVYMLNKNDLESVKDASLMQKETVNKKEHLFLPVGKIDTVLKGTEMIKKNLYLEKQDGKNIIYCLVHQNDIFKPEIVLPLLYAEELEVFQNKCFIIVNKFNQLSVEVFEQKLSVILKVRAMENYCAVILESPEINRCYQTGNNRTAQVVKAVNGYYGIDLSRTACGDAIWKNKLGGLMQAAWRDNYEWLVHNMEMLAERSLSVSRV